MIGGVLVLKGCVSAHTFICVIQVYLIECTLFFACGSNPFIGHVIIITCGISSSPSVLIRC